MGKRVKLKLKKRTAVVVVSVVALLLAGALGFFAWRIMVQNKFGTAKNTVCNTALIERSVRALEANDTQTYENIAKQVEATDGYANNIDCEYIIARNGIMNEFVDSADVTISRIEELESEGQKYSAAFGDQPPSVQNLKAEVQAIKDKNGTNYDAGFESGELNAVDGIIKNEN
jgi:metal-dependent amidase/aminoacylase/carboxypeptidase family protein